MFTGIIERLGEVLEIKEEGTNYHFTVASGIEEDVYIDQSISHNGVCLTVVSISERSYVVTAIKETMDKTNLGKVKVGDHINLERAAISGSTRMDGHMVQGHVDGTTRCTKVVDVDGSWYFTFDLDPDQAPLVVDKGSICVNGVSLTVVAPTLDQFQVAIIPYTYAHTSFKDLEPGDLVNLEYDIIGKYVQRYMDRVYRDKA